MTGRPGVPSPAMDDLHKPPRWSKTAVVVVLVVFGLVLIVAIFGLWAFKADQTARASRARTDAREQAARVLREDVRARAQGEFATLLERAAARDRALGAVGGEARAGDHAALRAFLEEAEHGRLVQALFRVDPEDDVGAVAWPGGRYRLVLSRRSLEKEAASQLMRREEAWKRSRAAREAERTRGAAAALPAWRELVRDFGLLAYVPEDEVDVTPDARMVYGLAWTISMLRAATNAVTADPDAVSSASLQDVVLLALENGALHDGRARLDPRFAPRKRQELESEIDRLLEKLPPARRELLVWIRQRFDAWRGQAQAALRSGRLLGVARRVMQEEEAGRYVVHDESFRPYGVLVGPPLVMLLLDPQAVHARVVAFLADAEPTRRLEQLGVRARVVPVAAQPDGAFGTPDGSVALRGEVRLPYRVDYWQIGDPHGIGDTRADSLLFWAVIALAIAGLVVGGYVLLRLLTREVRLAKLKADFVGNLSHELKTPITSISLFTEMLEDGRLTDPEEQEEAFAVLGQESRRLQRVVHRMIDVARGEARSNHFDLEPGDLNEPVEEAAARLRRIVTEPGLDLVVQLDGRPLPVRMDRTAVDDAVTNLLSNAWKYRRGDRARIVVRTARRGRFAQVVVSDDGIGIPRQDRRKVFDMFYRSEQLLTHPVGGTGLGLALVRSVVTGHRGRIAVESGDGGVGSRFRLRIPLDRRAAREARRRRPPSETVPRGMVGEAKAPAREQSESPASSGAANPGARS